MRVTFILSVLIVLLIYIIVRKMFLMYWLVINMPAPIHVEYKIAIELAYKW